MGQAGDGAGMDRVKTGFVYCTRVLTLTWHGQRSGMEAETPAKTCSLQILTKIRDCNGISELPLEQPIL